MSAGFLPGRANGGRYPLPSSMAATERHIRRRAERAAASAPAPTPPAHSGAIIDFRGVSKRYSSGDIGLDGVSFAIEPGEFVFLVGASGSGKSTTMRLLIKETEATGGEITRRRPRPLGHLAQARPVLPPQPRRRLPGLQAAAEPDGLRERRLRAAGHRRHAPRDPREGAGHPAPDRALAEAALLPRPALRRRAAARLGRARVRQPPAAAAGRRADRQPRSRDLDRDHAAALPDQPHGHDGGRRDARRRDGRPHAPARDRARRGARRARRARRAATRAASTSPREELGVRLWGDFE